MSYSSLKTMSLQRCTFQVMMLLKPDQGEGIHVQAGSQSFASHCKRPPIFFYVLNIKHFTSDNAGPNTNPKTLTTLNLTLNGRKDGYIISHSKFLPKVVGWSKGMRRTRVSLGPRLHILAVQPIHFFRELDIRRTEVKLQG